jgi:hypothetical protein
MKFNELSKRYNSKTFTEIRITAQYNNSYYMAAPQKCSTIYAQNH